VVQFFIHPDHATPLNKLLLEVSSADKNHAHNFNENINNAVAIFERGGTENKDNSLADGKPKVGNMPAYTHSYLTIQSKNIQNIEDSSS
jgi:hypothetical protein